MTGAVIKFANIIEQRTSGIQYSVTWATIARLRIRVFRTVPTGRHHTITPPLGYQKQDYQSKKDMEWLPNMSQIHKREIQYAANGGEAYEGRYKLDGYAEEGLQKYVYKYLDCLWHGCPSTYSNNMHEPFGDGVSDTLRKVTKEIFEKVRVQAHRNLGMRLGQTGKA